MGDFKKNALIHAALLLLMIGCMTLAHKPEMEVFYFLAGVLCVPVSGSLCDLFGAVVRHIKRS